MLLYTHERCLDHATQPHHPERPDRLSAVLAHFERSGLAQALSYRTPAPATNQDITRVHAANHPDVLEALAPDTGLQQLDPDTALCPATLEAARLAAGAVLDATRAVCSGADDRAFCAVRPPGHHAEREAAMGFCYFNSIAMAAAWALEQPHIERVAILDFDVHHGNGTVDIFADDPRVMVCSSYQHPFYPNRMHDVAREHIVHTPLPAGSTGEAFRAAVAEDWFEPLETFAPQLFLVSAGFDAHRADPLASLLLDESDFAWITREIVAMANRSAEGRIVSTLEGGYDLQALALSSAAHVEALLT